MKCVKCDTEMVDGIAIKPSVGFCGRVEHVNYENMRLVHCLKCPKCGVSDDGVDGRKLLGYTSSME